MGSYATKIVLIVFELNQSGFKVKPEENTVYLSKIDYIPVNLPREIPENAEIKGIIIKRYSCGDWKVILNIELCLPNKKPVREDSDIVGLDLNVSNFLTDSDGRKVEDLKQLLRDKWGR